MKKLIFYLGFAACLMVLPVGVQGYTINDLSHDAIGVRTFESYGINVYNFTAGVNTGAISFDLFTNYPQQGLLVGGWNTQPADLFVREFYYGTWYQWAIPLVNHDGFIAGTMYAVGSYLESDDFAPPGGGYIYNHDVPVRISAIGDNYGYSQFGGGSVTWNSLPGSPDYRINIPTNVWEDDPNGRFNLLWGTATCANDVITGSTASSPVPEPATLLLLGSGLLGMGFFGRKKLRKPKA